MVRKVYRLLLSVAYEASFLLFPAVCLVCGRQDYVLCARCFGCLVNRYRVRPVERACKVLVAGDGVSRLRVYAGARYAPAGEHGANAAVIAYYKRHGEVLLRRYVTRVLAKNIEEMIKSRDRGGVVSRLVLVPVPYSVRSFLLRGFSPVGDILDSHYFRRRMQALTRRYGVGVEVQDLLRLRLRNSVFHVAQKKLSARERAVIRDGTIRQKFLGQRLLQRQLADRFGCGGAGRLIYVLVDDVLTTGATLNEAHKILKKILVKAVATLGGVVRVPTTETGWLLGVAGVECDSAVVLASTGYPANTQGGATF